jgi:hypothetical protein
MELEGFGVSLVGRAVWVYSTPALQKSTGSSGIPWEFLESTNYTLRILVTSEDQQLRLSEAERGGWNCVWTPKSARDWSCVATTLKAAGQGNCLLVFDTVSSTPPPTFWPYVEGLMRDLRISRIWIHSTAPPWIPDAIFFPPLHKEYAEGTWEIIQALPARSGHGPCRVDVQAWTTLLEATREQELGIVVTDSEESAWVTLWHRPSDSRLPLEKQVSRGLVWIQTGTCLMS